MRAFGRHLALCAFVLSLAVGSGAALSACGNGQKTTEEPDKADDEEEVSSKGKKWGGWRWKGKRNDCFFVFKNECFASRKKACKKAGCGEARCEHNDSAPAKVSCKKKKS